MAQYEPGGRINATAWHVPPRKRRLCGRPRGKQHAGINSGRHSHEVLLFDEFERVSRDGEFAIGTFADLEDYSVPRVHHLGRSKDMNRITMAALFLSISYGAASAQTTPPATDTKPAGQETSRAECLKNFQTADADGDGTISVSEAQNAPNVVPTNLGLSGPITQQEFLTSCEKRVPKGG
jgi:hypothetical protein